jgi:hypothetical protein
MSRCGFAALAIALGVAPVLGFRVPVSPASPRQSTWSCLAKPIEPCVRRHGRLSGQNGIAVKIWLIGTTRMVAVENGVEGLPVALQKYMDMTSVDHSYVFGDFDICPIEPDVPGQIRRACIAGGERLVVQPLAGSRRAFRLVSTWPGRTGRESPVFP